MAKSTWQKNRIGRRLKITYCRGFFYNTANEKTGFNIRLWGDYDLERATKEVAAKLGTPRLLIEEISYDEIYASMTIDKFYEMADVKYQIDTEKENEND